MLAMSWKSLESKLHELGMSLEHFPDSPDIRVLPPKPCCLVSVPCGSSIPFTMECHQGADLFYCVGREGSLIIPNEAIEPGRSKRCRRIVRRNGPLQLSFDELIGWINGTRNSRCGTSDDFYAIPASGAFMLYVSHHDEVLLYFGWSENGIPAQSK